MLSRYERKKVNLQCYRLSFVIPHLKRWLDQYLLWQDNALD